MWVPQSLPACVQSPHTTYLPPAVPEICRRPQMLQVIHITKGSSAASFLSFQLPDPYKPLFPCHSDHLVVHLCLLPFHKFPKQL